MEAVEDDRRLGQMGRDRLAVGRRHVHRHRLDLRLAALEPLPEGLQCLGPLAVADEDHRSAVQVQDDGQGAVPLGDGDLVDGESAQVLELGPGEAAGEVALLDVLDHVPADAQVQGHVADGHAATQLQGVALEGVGGAAPRIGEGDLDLPHHTTGLAFDARDGQNHEGGAAADGHGSEAPLDPPAEIESWRSAGGAAAGLGLLTDGEDRLAVLVVGAGVVVATDSAPLKTGEESRMKAPYGEDPASHPDPESCVRTGNGAGEALTGAHAGQPSSCEIYPPGCRRCYPKRKATPRAAPSASRPRTPRSRRPCACVETPYTGNGRSHGYPPAPAVWVGWGRPKAVRPACTPVGSRTTA